ncbi:histidine triad nucleotide-binding protein [Candidatus Peregrinibacteria bacterium]|nr:histidine triad nucleotide-binding protein [Candidatus Peregrinibacteria bacterium]
MEKTIFQKIIDREIPAKIEYEDEDVIVIHDIHPKAPVHLLVIPKKMIPTVMDATEVDEELMGKLIFTAKNVAKKLGLSGYKLLFNVGKEGGQVVPHVHLHLLGGGRVDISQM